MDKNGNGVSRRGVVASASVGIAAAAGAASAQPLSDPTTKYPRPPFSKQSQPWPGLAREMNPRPDHGETSYRGSGRLLGRKALITGGDSGMGRAAAIAFAREGANVAINYLPAEEPDAQDVIGHCQTKSRGPDFALPPPRALGSRVLSVQRQPVSVKTR